MAGKKIADLFKQPIYFDPPENSSDVIVEGSDGELSDRTLQQKHEDIEHAAKQYLLGRAPFIASAALRGPFTETDGWKNPWKKERKTQRSRREGVNVNSRKVPEARGKIDGLARGTADRLSRARRVDKQYSTNSSVSMRTAQSHEQSRGVNKATNKSLRDNRVRNPVYISDLAADGLPIDRDDPSYGSFQQQRSRKNSLISRPQNKQQPRASTKVATKPNEVQIRGQLRGVTRALPHKDTRSRRYLSEESEDELDLDQTSNQPFQKNGKDSSRNFSTSRYQGAQQPRSAAKAATKPLVRKDMPPPDQSDDTRTKKTLPSRSEEPWLKRKLTSSNSLWEAPPGSTPTPATVVAVPSNKRKRRSPIVRTPSDRSARSSVAELPSNTTGNESRWQHAQHVQTSRTSQFDHSYNSTGASSQRQDLDSTTNVQSRKSSTEGSVPARGRHVINTIVTESAGKRMSLADKMDSFIKPNFNTNSVVQNSSPTRWNRSQLSDDHAPISSGADIARRNSWLARRNSGGSRVQPSERNPDSVQGRYPRGEKIVYTEQKVDSEALDEKSLLGLSAQAARSDMATPLSAQVGSFRKYQLDLPNFDFDQSQSQKPLGGDFMFSFNGGVSSQVPIPSIEPASRPVSSHSQSGLSKSNPTQFGYLQGKSLPAKDLSSAQAPPASRFADHSFHFPRKERGGQAGVKDGHRGAQESATSHDDVAEELTENGIELQRTNEDGERRLRRSMTFEEDDSPGFMGPRQKRHREKSKLKRSKPSEQREPSIVSNLEERHSKTRVEEEPVRGISIKSDPNASPHKNAVEISRPTLSISLTVNRSGEPTAPENLAKIGEASEPSPASPKLVISTIISEHISPEKPTSSPRSPEIVNPAKNLKLAPWLSLMSNSELDVDSNNTDVHSPDPQANSQSPGNGSSLHASESAKRGLDEQLALVSPSAHEPSSPEPAYQALVENQEVSRKSPVHTMVQPVFEGENDVQEELVASPIPNLRTASVTSQNEDSSTQVPTSEQSKDLHPKSQLPPQTLATSQSPPPHKSPAQNLPQSPFAEETTEAGLKLASPRADTPVHQEPRSSWSFNDTTMSNFSEVDTSALLAIPSKVKTPIGRSALSKVESSVVPREKEVSSLAIHQSASPSPIKSTPALTGVRLLSNETPKDGTKKAPIRPSISVEDIVISSDDEEEDIPKDRPAPVSSLRSSFLSSMKKKGTKKSRKPRKPLYTPYESSQTPEKVAEQQVSVTHTSPIQEPQTPWNVADDRALSTNYPLPVLKTPANNLEGDSKIQSHSTDSRIASELQTGWDESGFEYVRSRAASNRSEHDLDSELHQKEHSSPHAGSEHSERAATPSVEMSPLRPFRTFVTPSPVKQRKSPLEVQEEFQNTQALVDAALNNPWASTKLGSKKRVSFAPSSDAEDEEIATEPRPGKRQRLISPPPASDDSIGIDGVDDKLARRLRATRTFKVANKHPSSPAADAMAQAFIAADIETHSVTMPLSKGKRKSDKIGDSNSNGTPRSSKRQFRPSQTWEEDDDEVEPASSFEITPEGRVTSVKKTPTSSLGKAANKGAEENIASLVENNLDEVIFGDVSNFLQGWDVDEEVRRMNGGA